MAVLVAKVDELKRLIDAQRFHKSDNRLQIVALFARNAQFVALDGHLHFGFGILNRFGNFLGDLLFDALFDGNGLPHHRARGFFLFAEAQSRRVQLAAGNVSHQQFVQLFQL